MRRIGLGALAATFALAGAGIFVYVKKYDEWFTYPPLREHVSARMKDPSSAQYRNEHLANGGWLCGEINVKNGMGGYTGFVRYIARSSEDAYVEGIGKLGGSNLGTEYVLALLDKQTEILKEENATLKALKQANPDARYERPSEQEIVEKAKARLFAEKWDTVCKH